ncbi:hypothetical protein AMS68_007518 [Peltaster fructicola]|uniref:Cytochrome c oxidase assembly protein COX15 n=1 Tax=Peltaster fructicola TaxID=286661 RepID=A0A6H0Y511_9PEZI|nr:hypothetical protein AMS68_007518 [Peltaster fructicola]
MASITAARLSTRFAIRASKLLEDSLICRRCMHQRSAPELYKSAKRSPFYRHSSSQDITSCATARRCGRCIESFTAEARKASCKEERIAAYEKARQQFHRGLTSKYVAYWLLGSAASVFGIVIFGGLTRLTESGLSITEWKPITGSVPPRSKEEWEAEFAKYKASPEFIMLNSRMDLDDFKRIYWMEWIHRQWGRIVGITFLLPTIGFIATRRVSNTMAIRLVGICGLIGFQGFLGWWMVKSGLKDDLLEPGSHPRVSQYRLAAHLGTAFVTYVAMLWNGLRILQMHSLLNSADADAVVKAATSRQLTGFRRSVAGLSILVFTTVMSGALVAGLDAGMIYNDFPWMGQGLLPPKSEMLDPFYSRHESRSDLLWRNMLENPVLVQLDHRVLATTTFCSVLALWAYSRRSALRPLLKQTGASKGVLGLVHLVSLQVTLGITTLWYLVPTPLASAHQAGALLLLSGVVVLATRVSLPKRLVAAVRAAQRQALWQSRNARVRVREN